MRWQKNWREDQQAICKISRCEEDETTWRRSVLGCRCVGGLAGG